VADLQRNDSTPCPTDRPWRNRDGLRRFFDPRGRKVFLQGLVSDLLHLIGFGFDERLMVVLHGFGPDLSHSIADRFDQCLMVVRRRISPRNFAYGAHRMTVSPQQNLLLRQIEIRADPKCVIVGVGAAEKDVAVGIDGRLPEHQTTDLPDPLMGSFRPIGRNQPIIIGGGRDEGRGLRIAAWALMPAPRDRRRNCRGRRPSDR